MLYKTNDFNSKMYGVDVKKGDSLNYTSNGCQPSNVQGEGSNGLPRFFQPRDRSFEAMGMKATFDVN